MGEVAGPSTLPIYRGVEKGLLSWIFLEASMLVAAIFPLALVAMLLFATHKSRPRRLQFSVSLARLLSVTLEVDGETREGDP